MKTRITTHPATLEEIFIPQAPPSFPLNRTVQFLGPVTYAVFENAMLDIKALLKESPDEEICLLVTSHGGPTGTAMSFYDTLRYVLRANLVTIGSGDVDSAGVIIYLTGSRRYITKNTTLLLHMAGRTFDQSKRYTALDMEIMAREDTIKDHQYATVIADSSNGRLTKKEVLAMMRQNTILLPEDMVEYGLALDILE